MRAAAAICQFIHEQALRPGRSGAFFKSLRKRILRHRDPVVQWDLEGRRIFLNLSHQLPFYRQLFPGYSANLTRLAGFLRKSRGALRMIDVGANVGDSYCLARPQAADRFLLIEGDPAYFGLLERNTAGDPAVTRVRALLAEKASVSAGRLVPQDGTGRIEVSTTAAETVEYRTVDDVVDEHREFAQANLLKIDVEGYDCRVLMGARRLLATARPVLFFEHHPQLLARAGENDSYIFPELGGLGYQRFIFYDNKAVSLSVVNVEQGGQIKRMMEHARRTRGYYYDVCAFPDEDTAGQDAFLELERGEVECADVSPRP